MKARVAPRTNHRHTCPGAYQMARDRDMTAWRGRCNHCDSPVELLKGSPGYPVMHRPLPDDEDTR